MLPPLDLRYLEDVHDVHGGDDHEGNSESSVLNTDMPLRLDRGMRYAAS